MAKAQCARTPYDEVYNRERLKSEPNFDQPSFPNLKPISCDARIASASPFAHSPQIFISTASPLSPCFGTADQPSLGLYETQTAFTLPTLKNYTYALEKPKSIHVKPSIEAEENDHLSYFTAADIPTGTTTAANLPPTAVDDIVLPVEPSGHVDYLSHDWKEEDI
ncbi:hypothetical protein TWF694_001576 [Orbilia ellipsospora]|uniref:Uncharacterized protein n=1 Tax=Orbilia ellipsospora TaxID=2528407 RepID=A0AAV9XVD5_9PEZI